MKNTIVNIPVLKELTFTDVKSKPNVNPALKKLLVQIIKGQ